MTVELSGHEARQAGRVPDDIFTALDRVSERVDALVDSHDRLRDGFVLGIVMMVLAVGYGIATATPGATWVAPALPLLGAGFGWWGSRRERHILTPLPDHPVGTSTRLSMLQERVDALSPWPGIQVWGHSLTRVASWFQMVVGGGLAVVAVGAWFLQDHPVSTLGIALLGLGLAGLGGIMLADGRRQAAVASVRMEFQRLHGQLERVPDATTPATLRDRIAAQNELDELRDERKQWIQIVGFGVPGVFAIQYLLGELQTVWDVIFVLVFAVVGFWILARPVLAKRERVRELEEWLEALDGEAAVRGEGAARGGDERRRIVPATADEGSRPGKGS